MSKDTLKNKNLTEEAASVELVENPQNDYDAIDDEAFEKGRLNLKKGSLAEKLYGKKYLGICFLVPLVLMLLVYVAMGVWPVKENSVLVLDLNAQYVYFLEKFRNIILEGGSFLYSFERALGGEFMGIFAYYVASPFNLISLLFPKEYMTEALLTIFVLKCGSCGLTFGIFIHNTHKRRRPIATIMFSTMYALSAFAVVMQHNMMWTDNIILLPLIMLGIEELIKHGKFKLFTISLAVAVFSNFYIGYMSCIFVAIYFLVRYFTMTPEERNPTGVSYHLGKTFLRIAVFSIIAVMIAAVIVLTAYYSLSFGKSDFSEANYAPKQLYDFTDILSKIYFGSYDSVRPEGTPFLYAGMLMAMLAPLYFFVPSIATSKKIGAGLLMTIFLVSFNLSTADLFWHGFQRPNWLNARFAFMFVMIALLMAYEVFIRLKEISYKKVVISGLSLIFIIVFLQKMGLENLPDLLSVWASILIIGVYIVFLRFTYEGALRSAVDTTAVVLAILVSIEMFGSGVANLYALDDDVVFSTRTSYRSFLDPYYRAVGYVNDDGFYREEKLDHRKTNDNFAIGLRGLTNSTSTLNSSVIDLLQYFGFTSKSHWSQYTGGTALSDMFFGIKYIYANPAKVATPWYISEFYEYITTTQDGIEIYKNPYAFSVAFGTTDAIMDLEIDEEQLNYDGPFEYMNDIFRMISGNEDLEMWEKVSMVNVDNNGNRKFGVVDDVKHSGYEKNSTTDATVTFTIEVDTTDHIYMYIPTKWAKKAKLTIDGTPKGQYFTNDTHAIVDIGSFEIGDKIDVVLTQAEEKMYIKQDDTHFYSFNAKAFRENVDSLTSTQLDVTSYSETHISGTLSGGENGTRILTTIPYDKGWHISVDGVEIEFEKALGSLITFNVGAGDHEITFKYMSDSFVYGSILSVAGILLFAGACVGERYLPEYLAKKAALKAASKKEDEDSSETDEN